MVSRFDISSSKNQKVSHLLIYRRDAVFSSAVCPGTQPTAAPRPSGRARARRRLVATQPPSLSPCPAGGCPGCLVACGLPCQATLAELLLPVRPCCPSPKQKQSNAGQYRLQFQSAGLGWLHPCCSPLLTL